jgi:hypothetical protein
VQFTRNPQGLKEALVKIAATPDGSVLTTPHAEQAAHMFFAEGLNRFFATHPPILERIRELDPQFDERELARVAAEYERADAAGEDASQAGAGVGRAGTGPAGAAAGTRVGIAGSSAFAAGGLGGGAGTETGEPDVRARIAGVAPRVTSAPTLNVATPGATVSSLAGSVDAAHIRQAQAIHAALPDSVREFQSPGRAQAFVLALLLSKEPDVRQTQLAVLGQSLSVGNFAFIQQIEPVVDAIDPMLRLPALQQVFPSLRRAPVAQRRALAQLASQLIHADARIDAFEFSLAKLLETLLNDELDASAPHGTASLEDTQEEINVLFATLAQLGAEDEHSAQIAYEAGMTVVLPMRSPEYAPLSDWPRQLSNALPRLGRLSPLAKKTVIDGLVKTITSDEVMTEAEAELLRTVCALLHCPLPPLLASPPG